MRAILTVVLASERVTRRHCASTAVAVADADPGPGAAAADGLTATIAARRAMSAMVLVRDTSRTYAGPERPGHWSCGWSDRVSAGAPAGSR